MICALLTGGVALPFGFVTAALVLGATGRRIVRAGRFKSLSYRPKVRYTKGFAYAPGPNGTKDPVSLHTTFQ